MAYDVDAEAREWLAEHDLDATADDPERLVASLADLLCDALHAGQQEARSEERIRRYRRNAKAARQGEAPDLAKLWDKAAERERKVGA